MSRNIYKFLFLIYDCILTNFPDKETILYDVIKESIKSLSDYIIEYFELDEIFEIFSMLYGLFSLRIGKVMNEFQAPYFKTDEFLDRFVVALTVKKR